MKQAIICLIAVLSIAFTSCDHEATLTYRVKNNADDTITVVRTKVDGGEITDTFWVGYNTTMTIAVNGEGLNHVSTYKETGETLREFTRIDIYNHAGQQSVTNFLRTKEWVYKENGAHMADYTATVTSDDF